MTDDPDRQTEARRPTRRRSVFAAVAAAAVIAAAVWLLVLRPGGTPAPQGPLGSDTAVRFSGNAVFGEPVATGAPTAVNAGDRPAVLEKVALIDASDGIELTDTRIGGPGRGITPGMATWPDEEFRDLHPVDGYRLAPGNTPEGRPGAALVLIMEAAEPGRHTVGGVAVTYRVGDTRYTARLEQAFAVCSRRGALSAERCPAPARSA